MKDASFASHDMSLRALDSPLSDLAALLDAAAAIAGKLDPDKVAAELAKRMLAFIHADLCVVSKWDAKMETLLPWVEQARRADTPLGEMDAPRGAKADPLSVRVLRGNQPLQVKVEDTEAEPFSRLKERDACSLLMLPMLVREESYALIELFDCEVARRFSREEIALSQLLAHHAGTAIERTQLLQEAQQRAAELEALRQASLSLTASLDLEDVLNAILKATLGLANDAMDAHIFLYDGDKLIFGAALWSDGRTDTPYSNPRPQGLTYTVARSGEVLVIEDVTNHPIYPEPPKDWQGSIIGMPLRIGDRVVGVMNVAYRTRHDFSDNGQRVLSLLADQAALAIENARLHDLVSHQALTDVLTNLPNRRAFDLRLSQEIRRADRYQRPLSLIMLDLDSFKRVNDTFGHPQGDRTLRALVTCMQRAIRESDFLARWGGDEFAVILPETSLENAESVARKLKREVESCPFDWPEDFHEPFTLSIGCASFPDQAPTADALIQAADRALYGFKKDSPD